MAVKLNTLESGSAVPGSTLEAEIREALACFEAEWHDEAILACERALKIESACPEALYLLGLTSYELDQALQGIKLIEKAHELRPEVQEFAEALAAAYARIGRINEGLFFAKLATTLQPHPAIAGLLPERFGTFFRNLETGRTLLYRNKAGKSLDEGDFQAAATHAEHQLELTPGDVPSLRLLARASLELGKTGTAVSALQSVLHSEEATPEDLSRLGESLAAGGRHDEGLACYRAAVERAPEEPRFHSRLLGALLRRPGLTARDLREAHREWQRRHSAAIEPRNGLEGRDRDPDRPIRVAYLSGRFHAGEIMEIFEPVLRAHRRDRVKVFCYSDGTRCDQLTESLIRSVDRWTTIAGVDDETVWQILRGDEIDVVVDLSGHQDRGRLLALARRPAPVAVSWLGYPHAPGGAGIDYFLSDRTAWPWTLEGPGTGEEVWRAARACFAWRPPGVIPEVGPLPARQAGHATFGASCDLGLIGPMTAFHWAEVLAAVENGRLLICNRFDRDQAAIDRCLELFSNMGLRDRVDIVNMADNFVTPFEFYGHVDLALDPSSFGDLVEHCRALWMGVPLITLAGDRHAARLGASLLAAAGRPEWIAESPDALTTVASGLAGDLDRLAALRASLREEVAASPLADVHGFTQTLEEIYRSMWQSWCAA